METSKKKIFSTTVLKRLSADFTGFPLNLTVPSGSCHGDSEVFAEGLMAPLGQDTAGKTRVGLGQPLPPSPPSSDVVWVLLPSRRKAALRKSLKSFSLNLALCMFQFIY